MKLKCLTSENKGPYSDFDFTPYLPHDGKPGRWLPKRPNLEMCASGWHYCEDGDIIGFLNADMYEVEVKGKVIRDDGKCAAEQMRLVRKLDTWNERTARMFACDCAERVLPIYEREHPDDKRPRKAIETARLFADGKATKEDMSAARDAAWAAARAAARDAAWDAARDAARDAAWDAARDAAWAAAWVAAWDAARDAAWAAARAVARDAETKAQIEILLKYLEG